jgi:thioredoxin reductase (NADPH)
MSSYDVLIIGEGISGLMCAGYAAAEGLRVATIEANSFGGLTTNVTRLEDFEEAISGIDLASRLMEANVAAGVESIAASVTSVRGKRGEFLTETEGDAYGSRMVIAASGARMAQLNVSGEERLSYHGVSQCADCDGPMFQGQHVVVVGDGDSAFQAASTLAEFAARVTVVMRGDQPRAAPERVRRALAHSHVTLRVNSSIVKVVGDDVATAVRFESPRNEELACDGVFVYVGLIPNSEFAPPAVRRSPTGHLLTNASLETDLPGFFAIGAVRQGNAGQLLDAKNDARLAAKSAVQMLSAL